MKHKQSHYTLEENYGAYTPEDQSVDAMRLLLEFGPHFIKLARSMQEKKAVSHRDVYFGAVALLNNVYERKLRAYHGFNYSPVVGIPRYCAEMRANGYGSRVGYVQREAFVLATPTDPDVIESINGVKTPTAYPCAQRCRGLMEHATLIVSSGVIDGEDVYEVNTGAGLHDIEYGPIEPSKKGKVQAHPPIETTLISDPGFKRWYAAIPVYDELMHDITEQRDEELRMIRATAAVTALRSLAS